MKQAPSDADDGAPIERLRAATERIRTLTRDFTARGVRHDDADDELIGTFHTDDAIGFDPFPMLMLLKRTQADYAVFGQVAGIMHGSQEPTGDLDILWDGSDSVTPQMAQLFENAGVILRDDHSVLSSDYRAALRGPKAYFEGLGSAGDLCTPRLPWGSLDVGWFLRRKVWARNDSLAVPFLCLNDLISMRRAVADRPKHHRRLNELEELARLRAKTA